MFAYEPSPKSPRGGLRLESDELNPDSVFTLRGRKAPINETNMNLPRSQSARTKTSKGLSQRGLFNPDNDRRLTSLQRSLDLADSRLTEYPIPAESVFGTARPVHDELSRWYTRPAHLYTEKEFPTFYKMGLPERSSMRSDRYVGSMGASLAFHNVMNNPDLAATFSGPSTHYEWHPVPPIVYPNSEAESSRATYRLLGAHDLQDKANKDYWNLRKHKDNPELSISLIKGGPLEYEMARLRLERLRLEEDLLLERKREQEMERLRGPSPQWYELKNKDFSYECHKNNELLASSRNIQDLKNYKKQLLDSSRHFSYSLI